MSDARPVQHSLTQADSGSLVTVGIGDSIRISLPQGTTGFRWAAVAAEPGLRLVDDHVTSTPRPLGRPGERVLVFEAIAPGRRVLQLEKRRDADQSVAQQFQIDVEVAESPPDTTGT